MDLFLLLKIVIALGSALALVSIGSAAITLSRTSVQECVQLVVNVPGQPRQVVSLAPNDPVLTGLKEVHPGLSLRPLVLSAPPTQGNRQVAWGRIAIGAAFASASAVSIALPEVAVVLRAALPLGAAGITALGELVGAASNHRSEGKSRTESLVEAKGVLREIFDVSRKARR